jgi:uroporphyrin-III C-methyltransferase / precorrin-2 dehydrogenase / sirohydrochlorin ferrochelatase
VRYFPLFLDLRGRPVLVVGGGAVAERKVKLLIESGARVSVVAPSLCPGLAQRLARGELNHRAGGFTAADLSAQRWVIAATDDRQVNREIAAAAEARGLFVNVVDDAELSSAIMPAIIDRSPLLIAISSGGTAPMLARRVREQLEALLDQSLGRVSALLGAWRARIRTHISDARQRRSFYRELLEGPIVNLIRLGRESEAEQALSQSLAQSPRAPGPGRVVLVGAGPGDPGLLTLRALRALNEADVVLHDRLVSAEVLALVRRDAELLDVGKVSGGASVSQELINRMLVTQARAGRNVVRLKGGDPFIFGRGGEELEHLRAAGVAYECVPGVTAALACAASAGIPLTHREHARAVRFIAAHQREQMSSTDWDSLAASRDTLVVYMVVAALKEFCDQLTRRGRARSTPAAIIENGTRREQRVLISDLASIAELAAAHAVESPALLIVGEVAALGQSLHWFGAAPISADSQPAAEPLRARLVAGLAGRP